MFRLHIYVKVELRALKDLHNSLNYNISACVASDNGVRDTNITLVFKFIMPYPAFPFGRRQMFLCRVARLTATKMIS